ncbi:Spy/CpxP family protein refolding chaperone [Shewanella marina]|uniref:Spy/CpxP family protein refolding chaperone n=1 Tax=Shewanella marina TaxID=487319 RepID=UPI00131ED452|nr:Spy/CpxP family protein refolding chaperone [Shewanella marina]
MKSKIKMSLVALVASSTLLSGVVYAHNNDGQHDEGAKSCHSKHMKGHKMGRHMFRGLDLTEQQRTEIKALYKAQREQFKAEHQQMKGDKSQHKAEMLKLITADGFDSNQAQQLFSQREDKHEKRMLSQLEIQNKIYHMLTPEQQQKFKQRFEDMGSKHSHRQSH